MNQYSRYLSLAVLLLLCAQAFASDEIDRFVKRCEILSKTDDDKYLIVNLKKEQRLLRKAAVPIRLSFADCERVKHIIKLKNGLETSVDSYYSSKSNDDYRNTRSSWSRYSPSPKYWNFTNTGFGQYWTLINKTDGSQIRVGSECDDRDLIMHRNFVAVICQDGSYSNREPTLYVGKINEESKVTWRRIEIQNCASDEFYSSFTSSKFEFVNAKTLRVVGTCDLSRKNVVKKTVKVNDTIIFDESGLTVKSKSSVTKVQWD